jgi:hypothetical protein
MRTSRSSKLFSEPRRGAAAGRVCARRFVRSLAFVASALCGPAATAQDAVPLELARQEEHRVVLASERIARFLLHYSKAADSARAAARERLEAARPKAASAHWIPGLDSLREVESVLAGDAAAVDEPGSARLDAFAGSIDLIAIPGAFEIAKAELTEPITVRVVRAWGQNSATVEFTLNWLDTAGERVQARRESVEAGAFTPRGFPMYVRAPATVAGRCHLFGQLRLSATDAYAAVVPEVRVDAVENLRARLDALRERKLDGHPGYDRLRELTTRLLVTGLRGSVALGGGDLLLALESWREAGPPAGLAVPIELSFRDTRGVEHWLWSYSPAREPRLAVLFLAHSGETPDQIFAGPAGEAWQGWAEANGAQLFATHIPPQSADVAPLLERLREWSGGLELVAVARGDALGTLTSGVGALERPPFDAWIASTAAPAEAASKLFPALDGLVVAPGPAPQAPGRVEWLEGERIWLLNEPAFFSRATAWLARRLERR